MVPSRPHRGHLQHGGGTGWSRRGLTEATYNGASASGFDICSSGVTSGWNPGRCRPSVAFSQLVVHQHPFMSTATAKLPSFRLGFAGVTGDELKGGLGVPVLAGATVESLFDPTSPLERVGLFSIFETDGWRLGLASVSTENELEKETCRIYRDLFAATGSWHLARVWNYVPEINCLGADGLENYRVFCRGRSLAFEEKYGSSFKALLPAASAVGSKTSRLTVAFAAYHARPHHVENPLQVPAYDYPTDYGPRPPSFARATLVQTGAAPSLFVSGTAAIRGHLTMAPGDTLRQLEYTLENLRTISSACGLKSTLVLPGAEKRMFKVYLRHPSDVPAVAARLEQELLLPGDIVSYLHADICRVSLNVEIEASLR